MSYIPDIDPSDNKVLAVILWIYTLGVGYITKEVDPIPVHTFTGADYVELFLNVISKLTPVVSTFFLYIINKKAIDAFIKDKIKAKFHKKKP